MWRHSQEALHIVYRLPTCLLMSCMCLLRTCVLSSAGWQWRPGGQTPGLISRGPNYYCTREDMASAPQVVPPLSWGSYSDSSFMKGQYDRVWITLFNWISVLGSPEVGEVAWSSFISIHGTQGPWQLPLSVTHCFSIPGPSETSCQVVTLKRPDHLMKSFSFWTKTKKVSWPSDAHDSPKLHLQWEVLCWVCFGVRFSL